MRADYRGYERLASLQPVPLIGGAQAVREPWRCTLAHLVQAFGWDKAAKDWGHVECVHHLAGKPIPVMLSMLKRGLNCPPASSCGRLFDAVAAAVGICREEVSYEGQAGVELEALVDEAVLAEAGSGYAFEIRRQERMMLLSFRAMWQGVLADLADKVPRELIAARFHLGLARALTSLLLLAHKQTGIRTVVLGGGVLQNKLLLEPRFAECSQSNLRMNRWVRFRPIFGGCNVTYVIAAATGKDTVLHGSTTGWTFWTKREVP